MAFYTIAIVGLFLAGFFLLVVFGAKSYSASAVMQNDHMEMRALSAYIATSIKGSDSTGAVQIEQGPVLVIADGDTGYAKRIYQSAGNLVEDYARADSALRPDQAMVIAPTAAFNVEQPAANRLVVTTDEGRTLITLRSEGGEGE